MERKIAITNPLRVRRMAWRSGRVKRPRRTLRETIRLTLHSRGSPESIARGVALGLFIAFTPVLGLHLLIVLLIAPLFRASRAASVLATFVTNPLTIPPFFSFTYAIGGWILPGSQSSGVRILLNETVECMRQTEFYNVGDLLLALFRDGRGLFWPLFVGGAIVGLIAAAAGYPLTLRLVQRIRSRRQKRILAHPNSLAKRFRRISSPPDTDLKT